MLGIQSWIPASLCGWRAGICIWMLLARRCGIQSWMPQGNDATS
jgi:hypothetical protein